MRTTRMSNAIAVLVTVSAMLPAGSIAAGQEQPASGDAPAIEEGKKLFVLSCVQCHNAAPVTNQRKSADGWRRTVYSMIGRGAHVLPDEVEPLTSFLVRHYGLDVPRRSASGGAGDSQVPEGHQTIVRLCSGCHNVDVIYGARKSAAEWRQTIARMQSLGAKLTDREAREVGEILAKNSSESQPRK